MSNLRNILSGVKKKSLTDILAPVKVPEAPKLVTSEVPQFPLERAITQAVGQVRPTPEAQPRLTPELPKADSLVSQLKPFTESAQQKRSDIQEEVKSLRVADLPGIRNLPVAKTQQQLKTQYEDLEKIIHKQIEALQTKHKKLTKTNKELSETNKAIETILFTLKEAERRINKIVENSF